MNLEFDDETIMILDSDINYLQSNIINLVKNETNTIKIKDHTNKIFQYLLEKERFNCTLSLPILVKIMSLACYLQVSKDIISLIGYKIYEETREDPEQNNYLDRLLYLYYNNPINMIKIQSSECGYNDNKYIIKITIYNYKIYLGIESILHIYGTDNQIGIKYYQIFPENIHLNLLENSIKIIINNLCIELRNVNVSCLNIIGWKEIKFENEEIFKFTEFIKANKICIIHD